MNGKDKKRGEITTQHVTKQTQLLAGDTVRRYPQMVLVYVFIIQKLFIRQ